MLRRPEPDCGKNATTALTESKHRADKSTLPGIAAAAMLSRLGNFRRFAVIAPQPAGSVQARSLEKAIAVARGHAHLEGAAVAIDGQRHFDAGLAQRPYLAKEAGEIADLLAGDPQHHVAGAQIGAPGRATTGHPRDHDLVVNLGCVETEPRTRRVVRPAEG